MADIDDRLAELTAKLIERVDRGVSEARMKVELKLVETQARTELRLEKFAEAMQRLAEAQTQTQLALKAIAQAHLEHEDSIAHLALIAGNHEDRISGLEKEGE
jgi:hypothetical protein